MSPQTKQPFLANLHLIDLISKVTAPFDVCFGAHF